MASVLGRSGTLAVTLSLVALCVAVFLYEYTLSQEDRIRFLVDFALIPERLLGDSPFERFARTPAWMTLVTSIFLHGDLVHLIVNMIVLISFGSAIERRFGRLRYLTLFLLAGLAGGVLHALIDPGSRIPVVGASGALSGVLAAAFLAAPRQTIVLVIVPMPFWIAMAVLIAAHVLFIVTGWVPEIAWWAHIGGLVVGFALFFVFDRPPPGADGGFRTVQRRR